MVLHHMTVFTGAIILDMEQSVLDPPMPLHQGERPFGVYVRQAGHRVLRLSPNWLSTCSWHSPNLFMALKER